VSTSERLGRMQEQVDGDSATAVEHTARLSQLSDATRHVEAALVGDANLSLGHANGMLTSRWVMHANIM
jgi:hypothetical protein